MSESSIADVRMNDHWRRCGLALMSAERVAPVALLLGGADTAAFVGRALDTLWSTFGAQTADVEYLRRELRRLPAASVDDSYRASYYAMRALGIVDYALLAAGGTGGVPIEEVDGATLDLAADLEAQARHSAGKALPLAELERAAQQTAVKQIDAIPSKGPATAGSAIRASARRGAAAFADAAAILSVAMKP
jgi:hypothetical protein